MNKLPSRYLPVALPFVLSGFMSFLVSGVATLRGFGFTGEFPLLWMKAWVVSWPVAFPTAILAMPLARWSVALFVETGAAPATDFVDGGRGADALGAPVLQSNSKTRKRRNRARR